MSIKIIPVDKFPEEKAPSPTEYRNLKANDVFSLTYGPEVYYCKAYMNGYINLMDGDISHDNMPPTELVRVFDAQILIRERT